jgi:hypothetical protein
MEIIVRRIFIFSLAVVPLACTSQNMDKDAQFALFIDGFEDVRAQLDSTTVSFKFTTERIPSNTHIPKTLVRRYLCRDENLCDFNEWGSINYHYKFLLFDNSNIVVASYDELQYGACFKHYLLIISRLEKRVLTRLLLSSDCRINDYEVQSVLNDNQVTTYLIQPDSRAYEWNCDFRVQLITSKIDTTSGGVVIESGEWRCCLADNIVEHQRIGLKEVLSATCE